MSNPQPDSNLLPRQEIKFRPFKTGTLCDLLDLHAPALARQALHQLEYIEKYLGEALKCQSIAIEEHYIDRDYMEDHAIFYSKSLYPYPNFCRRVHFFGLTVQQLTDEFQHLAHGMREKSAEAHSNDCLEFSHNNYLGFTVIKPLNGSPVGRTILKSLNEGEDKDVIRRFPCTRDSKVHFEGIELSVRGLAFQQQDTGVSACATTALWSALHKIRDFEEVTPATPAQITMLASKYALPFGRALPSEGLSIDQMCVAVQTLGISPNLFRAHDFATSRAYIYSATDSGLPSVLILRDEAGRRNHAVTVAGMKLRAPHSPTLIVAGQDDEAGDLKSLYIHDDRHGPYLRADILQEGNNFILDINLDYRQNAPKVEKWFLTHILIPTHGKIRLSFSSLREITTAHLIPILQSLRVGLKITTLSQDPAITFQNRILQPQPYIRELLRTRSIPLRHVDFLRSTVPFSRYVGLARMCGSFTETIDVIFDTTSTMRNIICLGVFPHGDSENCVRLATILAQVMQCRLLLSTPV